MENSPLERLGRHGNRLKDLRKRVRNRVDGEVIVDGVRLVGDLVRWGVRIRELYLVPELVDDPEASTWVEKAGTAFELDVPVLADIAPTRNPQGVLAVVDEPRRQTWPARDGTALWLDRVQDPGNLGAIMRSAAGLGAAAVLMSPYCADPFVPGAVRGSAGAVFRIPIERKVVAEHAVERIRTVGGEVWATGSGGRPVTAWRPSEPCLILVGSEGAGLDPAVAELADGTVTSPLGAEIESLNVAVATGILLQHLRR